MTYGSLVAKLNQEAALRLEVNDKVGKHTDRGRQSLTLALSNLDPAEWFP